jgi:hypothetical protein
VPELNPCWPDRATSGATFTFLLEGGDHMVNLTVNGKVHQLDVDP